MNEKKKQKRLSGRLDFSCRAHEAIFHGEGVSGNTQMLRRQRVFSPSVGRVVRIPFVSGNSIKHHVRVGAVKYALDTMGIEDGSLTKPVVHLLFSGGSLGKKGSTVKIDKARELERLFPVLSLCGYSAANIMPPSKLKVDHLHLVCEENRFRMPESMLEIPEAQMRMSDFRGEEFGTRHEPTRMEHRARNLLPLDEQQKDLLAAVEGAKAMEREQAREKQEGSAQMIYEFEVIIPGSKWWGGMYFNEISEFELAALKTGIAYQTGKGDSKGMTIMVGGKTSIGFGRVELVVTGAVKHLETPEYKESTLPVPQEDGSGMGLKDYSQHLVTNKESILELLKGVA